MSISDIIKETQEAFPEGSCEDTRPRPRPRPHVGTVALTGDPQVNEALRELVRARHIRRSCGRRDKAEYWSRRIVVLEKELEKCIARNSGVLGLRPGHIDTLVSEALKAYTWFQGRLIPRVGKLSAAKQTQTLEEKLQLQNNLHPDDVNQKQNQTMNPHYLQTVLEDDINTVGCVFLDDYNTEVKDIPKGEKRYTFKTRFTDLEPGDLVIVNTAKGPRVVMVARVDEDPEIDENDDLDYQWVVQKFEKKVSQDLLKEDADFLEALRRKKRAAHRAQVRKALEEDFKTLKVTGPSKQVLEASDDDDDEFGF